jgi:hypothetical protein
MVNEDVGFIIALDCISTRLVVKSHVFHHRTWENTKKSFKSVHKMKNCFFFSSKQSFMVLLASAVSWSVSLLLLFRTRTFFFLYLCVQLTKGDCNKFFIGFLHSPISNLLSSWACVARDFYNPNDENMKAILVSWCLD